MAAILQTTPDSKVHGANMGPIWGREDPGGPHVGPMNLAIWDTFKDIFLKQIWWTWTKKSLQSLWFIYVIIRSGNGLSPIQRQTITWTNDDVHKRYSVCSRTYHRFQGRYPIQGRRALPLPVGDQLPELVENKCLYPLHCGRSTSLPLVHLPQFPVPVVKPKRS